MAAVALYLPLHAEVKMISPYLQGLHSTLRTPQSLPRNFTYTNANPALSAAYTLPDSTTVGTGTNAGLELDKAVDKASALPGANLTYITYTNNTTSPFSNLKINDSTPAYTTFVSASCGSPLPNNLTACSITSPAVGATGAIQWTFTGTLAPSQSSTVTFIVKIQ